MPRIVIFGANGGLANIFANILAKKGLPPIGVCRRSLDNGLNWSKIYETEFIDQSFGIIPEISRAEIIINTMSSIDLNLCESNPQYAYDSNVATSQALVRNVISSSLVNPYTVHISTDNVYSNRGYSSEVQVSCQNNYALSKLSGEIPIRCVGNHLILRTNYLARGIVKDNYCDWVFKSIKSNRYVNLYEDIKFNPTTAQNILENILFGFEAGINGTFNIGSQTGWSKSNFFLEVAGKVDPTFKNYSLIKCPQVNLRRPLDMRMSVKAAKTAGFRILNSYETINKLIEDFDE